METRLQKYLSECGIASRRKAEELILEGKIKVNGEVVTILGTKISEQDIVSYNDKVVTQTQKPVYIILNKPHGYVTTVKDQFNRATVMDLLAEVKERIYPVGRLDYDTSGLIIFTNDGELANTIMHPRNKIEKIYICHIKGIPSEDMLNKFRSGLTIEDYVTSKAAIEIMSYSENSCSVKITIHEGRNRQVKKMCEAIGHSVISLKRVSIGNINLGDLKTGNYRHLTEQEINYLKNL